MGNEQSKTTPGSDPVRRKRYKSNDSQLTETKSDEGIVRVTTGASQRRVNRIRRNRSYGPTETQTKLNFMRKHNNGGSMKKIVVSKSMSDLLEGRRSMINDDGSPSFMKKVVTTNGGVSTKLEDGVLSDEQVGAETQNSLEDDIQQTEEQEDIQTADDDYEDPVIRDVGVCDSEDEISTYQQKRDDDDDVSAQIVEQIIDEIVESSSSADDVFDDATAIIMTPSSAPDNDDDEQPPSGSVAMEVIDDIISAVINNDESETHDDIIDASLVECEGVDTESTNFDDVVVKNNPQTNKEEERSPSSQLKLMINSLDRDCDVSSNDSFISAADDNSDCSMGNQPSKIDKHQRNRATDQHFESCSSTPTFADSHMDPTSDGKLFKQQGRSTEVNEEGRCATEVNELTVDVSQVDTNMERGSSSSSSNENGDDIQQHENHLQQSDSDDSSDSCCSYVLSDSEQQIVDKCVDDSQDGQDGNVLVPVLEHQENGAEKEVLVPVPEHQENGAEKEVLAPVPEHQENGAEKEVLAPLAEHQVHGQVEKEVLTPVPEHQADGAELPAQEEVLAPDGTELISEDEDQFVETNTEPQEELSEVQDAEQIPVVDVVELNSTGVEENVLEPVVENEVEENVEKVVDDGENVTVADDDDDEHQEDVDVVADDVQIVEEKEEDKEVDDGHEAVVTETDVAGHEETTESEDDDTDSFKSADHEEAEQQQQQVESDGSDDEGDDYEQCKSEEECNGNIPEIRLECATDSSVCSHSHNTSSSDDTDDDEYIPHINEDLQLKLNEIVSDALRGAIGELRDFYVRKSQQENEKDDSAKLNHEVTTNNNVLQQTEASQTDVNVENKSTEVIPVVVQQSEISVQTDEQDDDDIQFVEQCENCMKMQNEAKMFFRGYMLALRREEELKIGNKWALKQRGKAPPMGSIVSGSSIQNSLTSSVSGGLDPNLSSLSSDASVQELRDALNNLEDKYKKSMVQNAQLDNERTQLVYQTQQLRDILEEQDDEFYRLKKEHREKCQEVEKQKRLLGVMNKRNNDLKHALQQRDELIQQQGIVLIGATDDNEDNERSTFAVVTPQAARLLEDAGDGTLDERLKHLAQEIESLQDTVKILRKEANERERNEMINGGSGHDPSSSSNINEMEILEIQRETNKTISEYKVKIQKYEQDVAGLQANVQRLETQLQRHKQTSEMLEKNEDEMRADKRKLQRDLRTALDRIEEHEITITHLERRLDRARASRSGTNNQT